MSATEQHENTRHEATRHQEPGHEEPPHERPTVGHWPGTRPNAVAAELRWVHDMLRRDLIIVQQLSTAVAEGAASADVEPELHALQTNGPLFQLRVNCLTYCQTLDRHHHGEDAFLFPAVRQAAPQLAATVDRLEADHLIVAALLEDIETLAQDLTDTSTRSALVTALEELSSTLLQHLDFEEATLQPVLETWPAWPTETPAKTGDEVQRRTS
jgi:hypothetical protein